MVIFDNNEGFVEKVFDFVDFELFVDRKEFDVGLKEVLILLIDVCEECFVVKGFVVCLVVVVVVVFVVVVEIVEVVVVIIVVVIVLHRFGSIQSHGVIQFEKQFKSGPSVLYKLLLGNKNKKKSVFFFKK